MKLSAGARLGPYEVLALAGTGGMGEVYRARDTRLGRTVAIKVSKEQFTERFEREARAIAALNHPHICHLYDVGPNYLVMEFVDGTPLGPIGDVTRLLDIGIQIADGLVAAHDAGVVHRDLKPGNIIITTSGLVKILDFGLAAIQTPTLHVSATPTLPASGYGVMVGTAAYMSPEQARAEAVDPRTDLWSLGVVLYETATGVRPFDGPTDAAVFEALLGRTPVPVRERNRNLPADLERIISRLLEKDRALRYQSAADLAADLKRVQRGQHSASAVDRGEGSERTDHAASRSVKRHAVVLSGVAALLAIAALVAWRTGFVGARRSSPAASPSEYTQLTNFTDSAVAPSLSPDGRMVTFIRGGESFRSRGQIYVKALPSGESVRLTTDANIKYGPVFTPDGSRVAYTRISNDGSWDTWTVPVNGGEPSRLLPNASGLVWMNDGKLLFSEIKGTGLHMGVVTSSEVRAEQREIYFPEHERAMAHFAYGSADRQWVLLSEMDGVGTWQPCRLVPYDGQSRGRPVGPPGSCRFAAWSPDGRWMYFSAQIEGATQVFRQQFPDGTPQQLTFGPTEAEGVAVAPDGRSLITSVGLHQSAIWIHEAEGDRPVTSEGFASLPRLSGNRVFHLLRENAGSVSAELRSVNLDSGSAEQVLPGVSITWYDVSSDGGEVVFTTIEGRVSRIWVAPLNRRTPPRAVIQGGDQPSFGADGEIVFRMRGERTNSLFRIRNDGSGPERVADIDVHDKFGVDPGGEWAIVATQGTGPDAAAETIAVSLRGGASRKICTGHCPSVWTPDGRAFAVTGVNVGPEQTLVLPIARGQSFPDLPASGIGPTATWARLRGAWVVPQSGVFPRSDFASYVFVRRELQRNLFRIPIQ